MPTEAEKAEALAALDRVRAFVAALPADVPPPPPPPPPPDHDPVHPDDDGHHPDDPAKHAEHAAMLRLVPTRGATHFAAHDGPWSDANTWRRLDAHTVAEVPGAGAKVWIPKDRAVALDGATADLAWLRVDGTLKVEGEVDLRVVTGISTPTGLVEIGTEANPATGRILLLDRGPRDPVADPLDLSGGLILHGKTSFVGRAVDSWLVPSTVPMKGDDTLTFAQHPAGWKAGDRLHVAGASIDNIESVSERRTIAAVEGAAVRLDAPLDFQHGGTRHHPAAYPVGKLVRSIKIESANPSVRTSRGHVMQMHSSAAVFDGVELLELGRTDAATPHTNVPGGVNQMGRYPLHLHIVRGANRSSDPMVVRNCVVDGVPKHGIVNHGAHAVIERNVVTGAKGSGIFCENGTEIGAVRRNLVTDCIGSIDLHFVDDNRPETATAPADFGADGVGIWLQGQNVDVTDNYCLNCGTGIEAFPRPIQGGEPSFVPAANLRPEQREAVAMGRAEVPIEQVPGYYARNVILGGRTGMSFWSLHLFSRHASTPVVDSNKDMPETAGVHTVIEDTAIVGASQGVAATYSRFLTFRRDHLVGVATPFGWAQPSSVPVHVNEASAAFVFEDCRVEHYDYPLAVPSQGASAVRNTHVDCDKGGLFVPAEFVHEAVIPMAVAASGLTWGPRTLASGNLIHGPGAAEVVEG